MGRYVIFILLAAGGLNAVTMPPLLNSPPSLDNKTGPVTPLVTKKEKPADRIPVKWGGSSLIQLEKKINGVDVTVYQLTGGAWIIHKNVRLSAGKIEIIGQDAVRAYLTGGVRVVDNDNGTVLKSARGFYDKLEESINIEGDPSIVFKGKSGEKTTARSNRIKRFIPDSRTEMTEYIEIHNSDYTIISDKAVFYEEEDRFEIPGKPMIFGTNLYLTGESLVYTEEDSNITLKNHPVIVQKGGNEVSGTFSSLGGSEVDKSKGAYKSGKPPVEVKLAENTVKPVTDPVVKPAVTPEKKEKISYSTADELVFHNSDNEESWTGLFGNARIVNEDSTFDADFIKTIGKDSDRIEARKNIRINDKKGSLLLKGNVLDYDKPNQYVHLTDEVSVNFLDKESGNTKSTMTAVELERFMDINEVVARGNVEIKGENYTARGAYATYFEDEKKIHLEGNPSLEKDKKKMYTGRIIIYPDTNQLIMSDGINAQTEE